MNNNWESGCCLEPVVLSLTLRICWQNKTEFHNTEDHYSMIEGKQDPFPEPQKRKMLVPLPSCIHLRDLKGKFSIFFEFLIDCILIKKISKETVPTCPEHIIQHWQPVYEKNLTWEPVLEGEVVFCEYKQDVFVEIVADHAANSLVPESPMLK